jgi:hypothetical protein
MTSSLLCAQVQVDQALAARDCHAFDLTFLPLRMPGVTRSEVIVSPLIHSEAWWLEEVFGVS